MAASEVPEEETTTPFRTTGELAEFLDSQMVPSSSASVPPILRVANEIEAQRPRIAYLFRYQAFEKAHQIDPTSSALEYGNSKQRLCSGLREYVDNEPTLAARHRHSHAQVFQSYYQQYYNDYVKILEQPEHSDRCGACFDEITESKLQTAVLSRDVIILNCCRTLCMIILMWTLCVVIFTLLGS